jgi:hypothetical protein
VILFSVFFDCDEICYMFRSFFCSRVIEFKLNGGFLILILILIFSKFASKSYSGTGLGLFIAKSIIESITGRYGLRTILREGELYLVSVSRSEVNDKQSPSKSQNNAYGELVFDSKYRSNKSLIRYG